MTPNLAAMTLYVKPGPTDMRKQTGGLALVAETVMKLDPFAPAVFLFCNKRRNLLKAVYWDKNGFCCWQKRLEQDSFPWPMNEEETKQITERELGLLLEGLDVWKAHKKLSYTHVG